MKTTLLLRSVSLSSLITQARGLSPAAEQMFTRFEDAIINAPEEISTAWLLSAGG